MNTTDYAARHMLETLVPALTKDVGMNERLKASDPVKWVGMMNTTKAQVEEIIWNELICI